MIKSIQSQFFLALWSEKTEIKPTMDL